MASVKGRSRTKCRVIGQTIIPWPNIIISAGICQPLEKSAFVLSGLAAGVEYAAAAFRPQMLTWRCGS